MKLNGKNIIVYGASGAIGGAVSRAYAAEGARVFLTGRNLEPLTQIVKEIGDGHASAAVVDALDPAAVENHAAEVARQHGGIDVSFNAIGIPQEGIQGTPLDELPLDRFQAPLHAYLTSHFLTATAASRHMNTGVIITLTAGPARTAAPLVGGMGPAWAGIEALTRGLAAELGPRGIRAMCLRADGLPETATIDTVFGLHARALGLSTADFTTAMRDRTLNDRLPTLAEVAAAAVYLASDEAAVMTGSVLSLSGGALSD